MFLHPPPTGPLWSVPRHTTHVLLGTHVAPAARPSAGQAPLPAEISVPVFLLQDASYHPAPHHPRHAGDVRPSSRALKPSPSVRLLVSCPPRSPLHDGRPWGRSQQPHMLHEPAKRQTEGPAAGADADTLAPQEPRARHSDTGVQALGRCGEGTDLVLTASEPRRQSGSFQPSRAMVPLSDTELPILSPHLPRLRKPLSVRLPRPLYLSRKIRPLASTSSPDPYASPQFRCLPGAQTPLFQSTGLTQPHRLPLAPHSRIPTWLRPCSSAVGSGEASSQPWPALSCCCVSTPT